MAAMGELGGWGGCAKPGSGWERLSDCGGEWGEGQWFFTRDRWLQSVSEEMVARAEMTTTDGL